MALFKPIVVGSPMQDQRRFQLLLIKPSHYDDDGYVIRWWRAIIPSNSLAALYSIAAGLRRTPRAWGAMSPSTSR